MVTPLPISVECGDDRTLVWNDIAWGYMGETMTTTPLDAVDRSAGGADRLPRRRGRPRRTACRAPPSEDE